MTVPNTITRSPSAAPTIFLGTSPLVLCHALTVCRRGDPVRILDAAKAPGGAWRTTEAFGCRTLEAAVHLIENRPAVYQALERLGIPLAPPSHRIGLSVGTSMAPLAWSRILAFGGVAVKSLARRDFSRAETAYTGMRRALRDRGSPFRYPARGAVALTDSLLRALRAFDVEPEFGVTAVRAVHRGRGPHELVTSIGALPFETLAISSRAHCELVRYGKPIELGQTRTELQCLALHLAGTAPRFEYVEFLRDSLLRRARNLTPMLDPALPLERHVISVQLRQHTANDGSAINSAAEAALARLARARLIDRTMHILGVHSERFEMSTIPDRVMRRIGTEQSDWLRAHRTTDFAEELCTILS
jgi:hypothetical protein